MVMARIGRRTDMDVKQAIETRRAYRSFAPLEVTEDLVRDLADAAHKAASCSNNQPWRFVFVYDRPQLARVQAALTKGNAWAKDGSMVVAVLSRREYDCTPPDRDLFMFDTGMATAHLILRATELGLLAHPIIGFDGQRVREVLGVPVELTLITLVIVGRRADSVSPALQPWQVERDTGPRQRKPLEDVMHLNSYHTEQEKWVPKAP
jgi:nitroreductase